jgi:hypothetical protein
MPRLDAIGAGGGDGPKNSGIYKRKRNVGFAVRAFGWAQRTVGRWSVPPTGWRVRVSQSGERLRPFVSKNGLTDRETTCAWWVGWADRPVGLVSAAVGPSGIPRDDRIGTVRRLSAWIRIDQRQPTEGTLDEQLVRILCGHEERTLTGTTHDGLLMHASASGVARARVRSGMRGHNTPAPHLSPQRGSMEPRLRRREPMIPGAHLECSKRRVLFIRCRGRSARSFRCT